MRLPISWMKSIRFQLTFWYLATLSAIFLVGGALLYVGVRAAILRQTDQVLATQAAQIGRLVAIQVHDLRDPGEGSGDPPTFSAALAQMAPPVAAPAAVIPGTVYARLARRQDRATVAVSPALRAKPRLAAYLAALTAANSRRPAFAFAGPDEEDRMRYASVAVAGTPYFLQVAVPWDATEDLLSRLFAGICGAIVLFLIFSGIGSWQLIRRTLSPIDSIVTRAEQQTAERLSPVLVSAPASSDNEVGHLVGALNRMMARIHSDFDIQRRFTADASHELRTPLTILQGELELALARERAPEEYRRAIGSGLEEIRRMARIVESLALLARYDSPEGANPAARQNVDLGALVSEAAELLARLREEKNLRLGLDLGERPALVLGDPDALARAVSNLIENAIKYTAPGGEIGLRVDQAEGWARLAVCDTGVGIAPDDLPHVFDRFFRADKSRANTGGSGLGLSIVQSIVQAHGGRVEVESAPGAGTRFVVLLPSCGVSSVSPSSKIKNF